MKEASVIHLVFLLFIHKTVIPRPFCRTCLPSFLFFLFFFLFSPLHNHHTTFTQLLFPSPQYAMTSVLLLILVSILHLTLKNSYTIKLNVPPDLTTAPRTLLLCDLCNNHTPNRIRKTSIR